MLMPNYTRQFKVSFSTSFKLSITFVVFLFRSLFIFFHVLGSSFLLFYFFNGVGSWSWGRYRHTLYWTILCEPGGTLGVQIVFICVLFCNHYQYFVLIFMILHQEDFFFVLHDILANMEEVTELQPVPDAHVPVMKFKFDGISIDLLYASISCLVVPEVSDNF